MRWTPTSVYLCALSYATCGVILVGTWTVQAVTEWPRIEATEPQSRTIPLPSPERAVNPAPSLRSMADAAARLCGVRPSLMWSLIMRESSGRHWDEQGRVLRSSAGALGLGQIMVATARDVSPTLDVRDPWQNAVASACHFRGLLDEFGDTRTALHAYHAGGGTVRRKQVRQETRDYASDIMGSAQ